MHRILTDAQHLLDLRNGLVQTVLDLVVSDQSLESELHSVLTAEVAMEEQKFHSMLMDEGAVALPISVKRSEAE